MLRRFQGLLATAALAFFAACGARSSLELGGHATSAGTSSATSTSTTSSGSGCEAPPPSGLCKQWIAGTPVPFATMPASSGTVELAGAITTPCGALVAWQSATGPFNASEHAWTTRAIGFDGAPIAPATEHPLLVEPGSTFGALSIARGTSKNAFVAQTTGLCRLLEVDDTGQELGSPIPVTKPSEGCWSLAWTPAGWSFLHASNGGATPVSLDTLDPSTKAIASIPLAVPAARALWEGVRFDDGSFLVNTFTEDPMSTKYIEWLEPFDASGASLHAETTVDGIFAAPVWLAPTSAGALAAWTSVDTIVRPIDRLGSPTGPTQSYSSDLASYGVTIAPTPSGDVLLATTTSLDAGGLAIRVRALGPDGVARGPSTLVASDASASRVFVVVETSGARALLLRAFVHGLEAVPLTCSTSG